MGFINNLKEMVTSDRKDVYRCGSCGESMVVDVGTEPDTCPICDATTFSVINRRTKV